MREVGGSVLRTHYEDLNSYLDELVNIYELKHSDPLRIGYFSLSSAVLKGISDGLSRGKKSEEMEKLVWFDFLHYLDLVVS